MMNEKVAGIINKQGFISNPLNCTSVDDCWLELTLKLIFNTSL